MNLLKELVERPVVSAGPDLAISIQDRLDDHTVLCKVSWTDQARQRLSIWVRVTASLTDVTPSGDIPTHVRINAIKEAQKVAIAFADVSWLD